MIATMIMKIAIGLAVLTVVCQACHPGFTLHGFACYSMPNKKATWIDAATVCALQGAFLADVTSYTEQRIIDGMARSLAIRIGTTNLHAVWIGGTKTVPITGQFRWIHSGLLFMYKNWRTGEPSGANEECVNMVRLWGYKWNNENCALMRHFVCKHYA